MQGHATKAQEELLAAHRRREEELLAAVAAAEARAIAAYEQAGDVHGQPLTPRLANAAEEASELQSLVTPLVAPLTSGMVASLRSSPSSAASTFRAPSPAHSIGSASSRAEGGRMSMSGMWALRHQARKTRPSSALGPQIEVNFQAASRHQAR